MNKLITERANQMGGNTNITNTQTNYNTEARYNALNERLSQKNNESHREIKQDNNAEISNLKSSAYEAIIQFSEKMIYSTIWICGGTTVSLLLFLEKIYNSKNKLLVSRLADSLLLTFLATLIAGSCYGFAYFSQSNFFGNNEVKGIWWNKFIITSLVVCYLFLVTAALILFFSLR